MMVDGIGGVWAASVLQQGEQSRAHRAREGRSRELRSRGAESRAVAWGGRRARGRGCARAPPLGLGSGGPWPGRTSELAA